MTLVSLYLVSFTLHVGIVLVSGAAFGDQCSTSSECTDVNTQCIKYLDCTIGTCKCQSGYGSTTNTHCQHELRTYHQSCDSTHICADTKQECSSTTKLCECVTWYTYHVTAGACTLQTYKLLTESCGGWKQEQCLSITGNECSSTSSTCVCQDGYTMSSMTTCRAPQYGEPCKISPDCTVSFNTTTISDDISSYKPTCNQDTCQCSPSHSHVVILGHNLCIISISEDTVLKTNGVECTSFNECESTLCVKCVGSIAGQCMANPVTDSGPNFGLLNTYFLIIFGLIMTSL